MSLIIVNLKNQIAYDRIVWGNINCFECPRCKKIVVYDSHYDENNFCADCDKYFTEEEIYDGKEKKKINFKVKTKD